ncbi:MAG: hypothetical protein ACT4R6_08620 [Gemmatimonadaceae bacterium]
MRAPQSIRQFGSEILMLACVVAAFTPAPTADAQLVLPKTIPVAQGDQFLVFPADKQGMGGVSIAVADTMLDGFVNPAKLSRVRVGRFYGAPAFYNVSGNAGSGRTLPLGSLGTAGEWSGALTFALQQLDSGDDGFGFPERLSDRSSTNEYLSGAVARRLGRSGVSLGASVFWAGLDALDGVSMLYSGSQNIEQFGKLLDLRAGITKEFAGDRTLELLVLHNRFDMTHDVTWARFLLDSATRRWTNRQVVEHNQDRTHTWGLHVEYERPLTANGWRIGWLGTFNRHSHPKIPNYQIQSIPRDPGTTWAYNLGFGLARHVGPASFGIDVIYEPMRAKTWADAARDTAAAGGGIIRAGEKTVENDFNFSNAIIRLGVAREAELSAGETKTLGVQFGVAMHAIDYRLKQVNNIARSRRTQNEDWVEWTPTWGVSLRFPELEIRYMGRYTGGVGRPGVAAGFRTTLDAVSAAGGRGGGFIAAPSGPLTLQDAHVTTHQVAFSLPMR